MTPLEMAQAEKQRRVTLKAAQEEKARRTELPQADMSFLGRLKDNVIGVDDGVMSSGEKVAAALNKGGESLTLGVVGDEAAAAADSLVGRGTYDERLGFYRDQEQQLEENSPKLALASEIAPAFIPGAGVAKAVAKLGSAVGKTAAGFATGAASGGVYGFAEGEGGIDERGKNAQYTAVAGGLFGAAAPKVTDFALSVPARVKRLFTASAKRPTNSMLKGTKNAAYAAVEDAGETFSPEEMTGLSVKVRQIFEDNHFVPETDKALDATLKLLDRRAGKPTTLPQLDRLRQNLWKRYGSAKDQPQILDAIKSIDDMIGGSENASELMVVARAANSRYAKSQLLEDAFRKADDQTSGSGSGGNVLNKYRQAVTSIINNPRKNRFFDESEIDMMREFVRGSKGENIKRLIGKMSPNGNGLMMTLHVLGGVASEGATIPLMLAGAAAKRSADKSVRAGAEAIKDKLAGFQPQRHVNRFDPAGSALAIGSAPVSENTQDALRNRLTRSR